MLRACHLISTEPEKYASGISGDWNAATLAPGDVVGRDEEFRYPDWVLGQSALFPSMTALLGKYALRTGL